MKKKQKVDYNAPAVFNPESDTKTGHLGFPEEVKDALRELIGK